MSVDAASITAVISAAVAVITVGLQLEAVTARSRLYRRMTQLRDLEAVLPAGWEGRPKQNLIIAQQTAINTTLERITIIETEFALRPVLRRFLQFTNCAYLVVALSIGVPLDWAGYKSLYRGAIWVVVPLQIISFVGIATLARRTFLRAFAHLFLLQADRRIATANGDKDPVDARLGVVQVIRPKALRSFAQTSLGSVYRAVPRRSQFAAWGLMPADSVADADVPSEPTSRHRRLREAGPPSAEG